MNEIIIKKDGIYFLESVAFSCFAIDSINNEYECIDYECGYVKNEDASNIMYVVKYLGNGVFEEMLTGKKIIGYGDSGVTYEDKGSDDVSKYCVLNYEDYIKFNSSFSDKEITIIDYIVDLKKIQKTIDRYPLTFCETDFLHEFTDENKKEYLKFNDEERVNQLISMYNIAQEESKKISSVIDEKIKKISVITPELLEEAYFDNQVYDFTRKGRTK